MGKSEKLKDKYEGIVVQSKQDGYFEIVEYVNAKYVVVEFKDTGYRTTGRLVNILNGAVKDRSKPSVYGVGILGEKFPLLEGTKSKEYFVWVRMLDRCYSTKVGEDRITYRGCTVSEEFKHFHHFKSWCKNQIGFGVKGFALDKDILVKGNKVYSPETCCFVPQEINNLFTNVKMKHSELLSGVSFDKTSGKFIVGFSKGTKTTNVGRFLTKQEAMLAYKTAKEGYVKEVANKWRDRIDPRVYKALMNWEVDLNA